MLFIGDTLEKSSKCESFQGFLLGRCDKLVEIGVVSEDPCVCARLP